MHGKICLDEMFLLVSALIPDDNFTLDIDKIFIGALEPNADPRDSFTVSQC